MPKEPGTPRQAPPTETEPRVGIIVGSPEKIISELETAKIGVGVFSRADLPRIEQALLDAGYEESDYGGNFRTRTQEDENEGELHRHGDDMIFVHQTLEGTGAANFYWPAGDSKGYDEDFLFNPEEDEVLGSATNIKINSEIVLVFPSGGWHQFSTNPNTTRRSSAKYYLKKG